MAVRARDGRIVLLRIDPVSFQHESIVVPSDLFQSKPVFHVSDSTLYLASAAGVSRYDLAQKVWRKSVVPFESNPRSIVFAEVHGRIILATTDSIFELSPDGQTAELLASRRDRKRGV